jgi:sugar porter (SP) family MFS transporter
MSETDLGLVTAVFSIGGLVSSLYAGVLVDLIGRKKIMVLNGIIYVIGSAIETISNDFKALAAGRFLSGLAAGCSIVATPLFISEISPHGLKGFLGSMNQVAINIGILITQVLAIRWGNNVQWRWLLLIGSLLGVVNVIAVLFIGESPKWLMSKGRKQEARAVLTKLRGLNNLDIENELNAFNGEDTLLPGTITPKFKTVSAYQYLTNPTFRNSLIVVTALMAGQQFCGVNSVIFYGVATIRKLVPDYAVIINCFISLGNAIITFAAAPLIDKHGRKPCLLVSVSLMGLMSASVSVGILRSIPILTVLATFGYVASFAVGLGPIPFLMLSEVTQLEARGTAQSYGTSINWIATFLVGYLFPILDSAIGGYVYYIFALICIIFAVFLQNFVPETKGARSYEEVWGLRVE